MTNTWNNLPTDDVTADTLNSFKKRFDSYISNEKSAMKYEIIFDEDSNV